MALFQCPPPTKAMSLLAWGLHTLSLSHHPCDLLCLANSCSSFLFQFVCLSLPPSLLPTLPLMESTKQWVLIKVSTIRDLIFSFLDPETMFQKLQWGGGSRG